MSTNSVLNTAKQTLSAAVDHNKTAAVTATIFTAAHITNNQLAKLASSKLPGAVGMLADTPIGKLVLANLFQLAIAQFRPGNEKLEQLSSAMTVDAYTQVFASFDIEGLIDELLSSATVTKVLSGE